MRSSQVRSVDAAMMEEGARSCLLQSRSILEQDIKASYLMDHMIADGVLTRDEEARIRSKLTRKDQAVALLEVLLRKDNQAYISFYNALVCESYGDLANLLHKSLPLVSPEAEKSFSDGGTPYVQTVLSQGGVPQRPVVFVSRTALLNRLREKLYRLQKEPGWVTVFGMAGSGKSILAAEAVRDHTLITECFPGGVHWMSIGQLDRSDLLARIQTLCFRLEQQSQEQDPSLSLHRLPTSLDEAKERLRFLVHHRYPRSLLILDDIWDCSVLKAFDIQCRVLLTTRDRSLADSVTGSKYEVAVDSGLEENQALEILGLYVNGRKPEKLPEQARSIVRECKGSPLVVSLIGALLRDFPDRWSYYLQKLKQKQFKRIRKSSSYDYDALDQAMSASIQVLPEEHRELYKDLTVLEKDVKVPAKVLAVLWDLEPEEVEDVLQDFVNKSLMYRDCHQRPYLYYLHDLQLDFLAEMNRSCLEDLHTKVVCQYQKHYSQGPPTSGDQECLYWFRFLPYHMVKANLTQELYSLMFSLDWVVTKAKIMGPAHLINDYVAYGAVLDKENSEVRAHFQEFLSQNGHQLEQRPFPDVVQLALSQPDSSEVYRQALQQAQKRAAMGGLYLDWVNKSSLESLSRLVVQPHLGSVYSACFSHDGSKIASGGSSKTLRVFNSISGEKLREIEAHEDEVLCCAFSPDDRLIATCSSDRKVWIWEWKEVFQVEHEEQINHCQFTNTQRRLLLATCSNDNLMNTKPSSQNTMFGHMEPVNHCCFSPDDTYLSTSSCDGTMKLWEVSSTNLWMSIDVASQFPEDSEQGGVVVKCSTWSSDGRRVICASRNAVFIRTSRLSSVQFCHACPNSNLVALALSHYAVELWDIVSNKKMADCSGHLSWVHGVQFSPDGSLLLSCSDDQTIRVTLSVYSQLFSGPLCTLELKRFNATVTVMLRSVLEVPSGTCLATLQGHTRTVLHCQFTPDGQTLISSSEDGTIRVWRWRTGECVVLQGHKEQVRRFSLLTTSPSDTHLLSWSFDGTVKVWVMSSGELLQSIVCHQGAVLACDISPDGQLFATTSADKTAKVWSSASWEVVRLLNGHQDCVRSCRFSWDGRCLATGDDNGEIRLWNIMDGTLLKICSRDNKDAMDSLHGGWVTDLHFSPDNTVLLSTGGYIKWWNVEKGEALQTFYPTGANLKRIHVSPDFSTFVTIDNIGILYILKKVE
uniref:Apoptotic protease-activating factor 1 n=1 Tax=Esox lucius TaxID=8010 RepID=A0A6Q2YJ50_ESOLU